MKKVATLIVLALFAGAVFFVGWTQLSVPPGKYGVFISKTGGIDTRVIESGRFSWRWERLIPTNGKIVAFEVAPQAATAIASGELPSASLYAKMLEGNPSFSWKLSIRIVGKVKPERLPAIEKDTSIKTQDALDAWILERVEAIARNAADTVVAGLMSDEGTLEKISAGSETVASLINAKIAENPDPNVEILECSVSDKTLPDFALYAIAGKTYGDYQKMRAELLAKTAAVEAEAAVSEYLEIERFGRWGELLTKYPILIDFLAVTKNDAGETFKAVRDLKRPETP